MDSEQGPAPAAAGKFFDGKTAIPKIVVEVRIDKNGISFRFVDSAFSRWNFSNINWGLSTLGPSSVRLSHLRFEDAFLDIDDPDAVAAFLGAREKWAWSHLSIANTETMTILRGTAYTIITLLALWFLWPSIADFVAPMVPDSTREALGEMAFQSFPNNKACYTPEGDRALKTIVNRLTESEPFLQGARVDVVRAPYVNAFTLPGNRVIVMSETLVQAQSADELAGVIAHELGHVRHDHVMRSMLQRFPVMITFQLLGLSSGGAKLADLLVETSASRKFETEADATALDLLIKAGVSPKRFAEFFKRREKDKSRVSLLDYISTHPNSAKRIAMIEAAQEPERIRELVGAEEWGALKGVCGGKK